MDLSPLFDVWQSSQFQTALANILILVITGVVATLARAGFTFIRTNTTDRQFAMLTEIAAAAVRAAEQGQLGGLVTDKKASATNVVNSYLQQAGLTGITAEQIDAAIESAVYTQFNWVKAIQPIPAETTPPAETNG